MLEDILIFGGGLFAGIFFTLFWQSIRRRWQSSKSLRQASAKARKENADRVKKAKADARLARDAAIRSFLEFFMFLAAAMLLAWLAWVVFMI